MAASSTLLLWPVGCRWALCVWAAAHSFKLVQREKDSSAHPKVGRSGPGTAKEDKVDMWSRERRIAGPTGVAVTMACAGRCGLLGKPHPRRFSVKLRVRGGWSAAK
ncbi:hypothetical protein IWX91DRAFT_319598 [Phyllosticta citricarpa]